MIYDVIGDIHGQATKLKGLLAKLGYTLTSNTSTGASYYAPPAGHHALFIGDLIDRGPQQIETLEIVFAMIDAGAAQAVMGNHEYNALAYATLDQHSTTSNAHYLREHNATHERQHQEFLAEVPFASEQHQYWLSRFYELPLWIETDTACFVHACWDMDNMARLQPLLTKEHCLTPTALQLTSQKDSEEYAALERVLKGVEVPLPNSLSFTDKDGAIRRRMRVQWWLPDLNDKYVVDIARAASSDLAQIPKETRAVNLDFRLRTDKPIFIGHYWLTGTPAPLSPQVVCTDYSAAGPGYLTAYRLDTSKPLPLSADNFVQYRHA